MTNHEIDIQNKEYEMTWTATMKDGSVVRMIDQDGNRISFNTIKIREKDIQHILWTHTKNKNLNFGVAQINQLYFMINGFIYSPISSSFYKGKDFSPELFIRNTLTLETGQSISVKEKEMSYYAGFSFTIDEKQHSMYVSWDGFNIIKHGFDGCEKIGEYSLNG